MALLVAGCATSPGPDMDPIAGKTLRTQTQRGDVTLLRFRRDGTVTATFNERSISGRWQREENRLCFYWTGAPRECWPYGRAFERGRTVRVTSDRGNVLDVTQL